MCTRPLRALLAIMVVGTIAAGCAAGERPVESAAPTTSLVPPRLAAIPMPPSNSEVLTRGSADDGAAAVQSVGIPVCGSAYTPFTASSGTSTPAPDTCSFPEGGSASPTCPDQPTEVVAGTETRPPTAGERVSGTPIAAFGRFGGRGGGPMCFADYPGGGVLISNDGVGVLLPPSEDPMRVAGRTQLARSDAVWGVVDARIDHIEIRDSARPNGITVPLTPVDSRIRVFVAPVPARPATVTAFSPAGTAVQTVRQG